MAVRLRKADREALITLLVGLPGCGSHDGRRTLLMDAFAGLAGRDALVSRLLPEAQFPRDALAPMLDNVCREGYRGDAGQEALGLLLAVLRDRCGQDHWALFDTLVAHHHLDPRPPTLPDGASEVDQLPAP